jgi:hypothetical protein
MKFRLSYRFRINHIEAHSIDDAENLSVRADPERQRDHNNQGEPGILQQHSRAEAQVLPECPHKPSRLMKKTIRSDERGSSFRHR